MTGDELLARQKRLLNDDDVIKDCLAVLKIAHQKGDNPVEAYRKSLAVFQLIAAKKIESSATMRNGN